MIVVACVLKTGGDFQPSHVKKLQRNVSWFIPDHQFVCLTDTDMKLGCDTMPLLANWPGYWSKLELFRVPFRFPVLYLDLDTVLLAKPERLLVHIQQMEFQFAMLDSFRQKGALASGVMAWSGDYTQLYHRAVVALQSWIALDNARHRANLPRLGDQYHIADSLAGECGILPEVIQSFSRVVSYKRQVMKKELPDGTEIVCFHGKPRPWDVKEPWMKGVYE